MKRLVLMFTVVASLSFTAIQLLPAPVLAADASLPPGCPGGPAGPPAPGTVCPTSSSTTLSTNKPTTTDCDNGSGGTIKLGTPGLNLNCNNKTKNPIYALLQFVINWAIRLLGVLAVLAIVISGIQYIVSQGNPDGIKAAKSRLTNAVVGLILLSLMFVILRLIGVS